MSAYVGDKDQNGEPHGRGTRTYSNGDKYEGDFEHGKRHGTGIHTDSDGTKYEGDWQDDKRHGEGTLTEANGKIFKERWENGQRVAHKKLAREGPSGAAATDAAAKACAAAAVAAVLRAATRAASDAAAPAAPDAADPASVADSDEEEVLDEGTLSPTPAAAAPAASDAASDADADGCTTQGLSGRKRKPKSGAQKRDAKKAKAAEGGYTNKGRMVFRDEGNVLITGGERTCLPDALGQLLPAFGVDVSEEEVRRIMPADAEHNTLFTAADAFVAAHGLELARVTPLFNNVKGGPELALLNAVGFFVVQLRVTEGKDDKSPDLHCIAYDGVQLIDNYKYSKVKVIDASDRASKEDARAPFDSLFPGLTVRITNVYELRRKA
eukprot:Transcript_27755.p1 GENE.Transcript_27755~~Transcript_27755.p1  ORF type:complete len:381 (+),score=145.37 Transcript_27755:237-1379(+)